MRAPNEEGVGKIFNFMLANKSPYLRKGARYDHRTIVAMSHATICTMCTALSFINLFINLIY